MMKNRLIFIFLLWFFFIEVTTTCAFSSKDNYLWIEFGRQIKEKDGILTLPLQINYGRFPYAKKGVSGLDGLRLFYTLNERDDEGERIFYEVDTEGENGGCQVEIKSFKTNQFIVFAQGMKTQDKTTYCYSAKTSFVLFGRSPYKREKIRPASFHEINRQFEISTTPEFSYWPQTGNPIKVAPLFERTPLGKKALSIFDENTDAIDITTDETGNYTYIPPEDRRLNWKGETAFKQIVIVAEETKDNTNYVSSYTLLLHRSRFKNRSFLLGVGIFCGTMTGVFLFVAAQRKRFKV